MLVSWWGLCYGCVLPASAGVGESRLLEPGAVLTYTYESTLLINHVDPTGGKDVGFKVAAHVSVETIWQSRHSKLLQVKVLLVSKCIFHVGF